MSYPGEQEFNRVCRLIKRGDLVAMKGVLDSGISANLASNFGFTLLMAAANIGNVAMGRLLISYGPDINRENFGTTALSVATFSGHLRFMEMLLESGADPNCSPNGIALENWMGAGRLSPKQEATVIRLLRAYHSRNSN
jgi:ankyrin repeat protein